MEQILKSIHSVTSSHKLIGIESEVQAHFVRFQMYTPLVCNATLKTVKSLGGGFCPMEISPRILACTLYFLLYHNINMLLASCSYHHGPNHSVFPAMYTESPETESKLIP